MTFTLTQYRQRSYAALGPTHKSVATAGSSLNVLEDTTWPIKSTLAQTQLWKDYHLFRPNAVLASDKVRIVDIYTPANGFLQVDNPYTNNPNTENYELCSVIPPIQDNNSDLHTLINIALKRLLIPVEFTITILAAGSVPAAGQEVTGQTRALLPTWMKYRWQLRQVGYLATIEDRNVIDPYRRVVWGEVRQDGPNFWFIHYPHQFGTDSIIYCRAVRTADTLCAAAGGTPGDKTGLSAESDFSVPDVEWVAAATCVEAWNNYGRLLEAAGKERVILERSEAAKWLTRESHKNVRIPPLQLRIPKLLGPPQHDIGHITYGFAG